CRRRDERPSGDHRLAGECTRHPHHALHRLPEKGPRHADGGSALRHPRFEPRGGTRLRVRDLGRRRSGGRSCDGSLAYRALPGARAVTGEALETALTRDAGIAVPLIGGAMFPCSNTELVEAVSEAGGNGIDQHLSMVYVVDDELMAGRQVVV